MMRTLPAFLALGAAVLIAPAAAQPAAYLQDLTITQVASGLTHAGDVAADCQGNAWIVAVQGTVGGAQGSLTRVTAQGVVTPGAVTGLAEVGDLVRGSDGNIWFWANVAAGVVTLNRLTPAGVHTVTGTFPAPGRAAGIAQDGAGSFYLGAHAPAAGIWRLVSGGSSLILFAAGIPGGDHLHLAFDAAGSLLASSPGQLVRILGPGAGQTAPVYVPPQPLCPNCGVDIPNFALGWYGHVLPVSRFDFLGGSGNSSLLSIRALNMQAAAASLGSAPVGVRPALAEGCIASDLVFVQGGGLYRLSGTPAILTIGYPTFTQIQGIVDAPAGSPLTIALDAPNLVLNLPPWGTFHTSLGLLPTFFVLADGLGAFGPPDPSALAPWTATYLLPPQPLNAQFTVEAYVLHLLAGNGLFQISNFEAIWL